MLIYETYGVMVNLVQMKKHLNYHFREIIKDQFPVFALAFSMAALVYLFSFLNLDSLPTLIIQGFVGVVFYIVGSYLFKVEGFDFILDLIKRKLLRRK